QVRHHVHGIPVLRTRCRGIAIVLTRPSRAAYTNAHTCVPRSTRALSILQAYWSGEDSMPLRLLLLLSLVLGGCASSPPRQPDNICEIFAEKHAWHRAAQKAE